MNEAQPLGTGVDAPPSTALPQRSGRGGRPILQLRDAKGPTAHLQTLNRNIPASFNASLHGLAKGRNPQRSVEPRAQIRILDLEVRLPIAVRVTFHDPAIPVLDDPKLPGCSRERLRTNESESLIPSGPAVSVHQR